MQKTKGGTKPDTVNAGPAPRRRREGEGEFDIAGNVKERGGDPSPDDRERGETAAAKPVRRA